MVLKPQEFRRYELPYPEGWALVITVIAECSNGSDHCSRDRSISLTPITNPSQFLRPATSVPSPRFLHKFTPCVCAFHLGFGLGLVPARQIRIVADVEEWRNGSPVRSKCHQKFQAFEDSLVVLKPQEFRRYELPYPEGWALVITVIAECSNGSDDEMYFAAGDHPPAVRSVAFGRASTNEF